MKVDYLIAIDDDHAIWRAFNNEYWPALYFIDARGHIRHSQFGEGDYEKSESFNNCLAKLDPSASETGRCPSMRVGWNPPPIGVTWNLRKRTSALTEPRILRLPAVHYWPSIASMLRP